MGSGFHALRVAEVRRETEDAVSIQFDVPPHLADTFAFRAGQHLTLRREIDGEDVRRNYSLCLAPSEGALRIAVKRIAGGVFSGFATTDLAAGDVLDVMAPHGSFCWAFSPTAAAPSTSCATPSTAPSQSPEKCARPACTPTTVSATPSISRPAGATPAGSSAAAPPPPMAPP